jgi:uncharacterized protein YegP (UPF0339 family)
MGESADFRKPGHAGPNPAEGATVTSVSTRATPSRYNPHAGVVHLGSGLIVASQAEFKVRKDKDGKYSWHLQAANNRIVCWSGQGYLSKQACVNELYWIKENAADIPVFDYTGES